MTEILNYIGQECDVVSSAPLTIFTLAALIWAVFHFIYRERLKSSKEIIELLNQKISLIVDKTGASSIEGALARISALETEFKELGETDFAAMFNEL